MLIRTRLWFCFILSVTTIIGASSALGDTNWQLVFRYDAGSLQLLKVDPIIPTVKVVQTPGLKSAPVRVAYRCDWLDAAGRAVHASSTELPLGIHVPMGDSLSCQWYIPEQGIVVVRLSGPDPKQAPENIRLSRTGVVNRAPASLALPAPFQTRQLSFSTATPLRTAAPTAGPVGVQKIRDTGPDGNRLVIVAMSDGYTATDLSSGAFETAAAGLAGTIQANSPWDLLFEATNMYRVDIESNESGADHEVYGVYKDTYLNSSFWVSNIERLLALTDNGYYRAVQAADAQVGPGVWDLILVLVNSTKYGGSGGSVAVSSIHSSSAEVIIHEMGHTVAHLADEYETAYPGYPVGDWEANVDFDYFGEDLKWHLWVDAGTPLPTPEVSPYLNTVGAFEGARYLSSGIYRPYYSCKMRSLNVPFCPVCKEAHVVCFADLVSLVDSVSPADGTTINVGADGAAFVSAPIPLDGLEYEWRLDGVLVPGAGMPTLDLTRDMLTTQHQTLSLNVVLNTDLVRVTTISDTFTWPVTAGPSACCNGIVGDANNSGDYEPTIGDVSALIDHLFVSQVPLVCYDEADVNQSGGLNPDAADITIGDVSMLIDHLFISEIPIGDCF